MFNLKDGGLSVVGHFLEQVGANEVLFFVVRLSCGPYLKVRVCHSRRFLSDFLLAIVEERGRASHGPWCICELSSSLIGI